jgi:hypothetical protein
MGGGGQPRAAEEARLRQRRGRRRAGGGRRRAAGRAREGARGQKWPRAWRARALEGGSGGGSGSGRLPSSSLETMRKKDKPNIYMETYL